MKETKKLEFISKYVEANMTPEQAKVIKDEIRAFIAANTPQKVGKLNLWDWAAKYDYNHKQTEAICYNDTKKEVCVTDTAVLLVSKSMYTEPKEDTPTRKIANTDEVCRLLQRNGEYMEDCWYPNYHRVIPNETKPIEHLTREQCKDALRQIKADMKVNVRDSRYYIKFAEGVYLFPEVLKRLITLPQFEFTLPYQNYPLKYEDGDITAIAMPTSPLQNGVEIFDNVFVVE